MPFCANCGQETNGANFCPNCGFPQEGAQPVYTQVNSQQSTEYADGPYTAPEPETFTYDQTVGTQSTYDGPVGYDQTVSQGTSFDDSVNYNPQYVYEQQQAQAAAAAADQGSFGWAVLGFFVPLVGLILFIVWRETKPVSGKQAGVGALVSVIVSVVISILATCAGIVLYGASAGM